FVERHSQAGSKHHRRDIKRAVVAVEQYQREAAGSNQEQSSEEMVNVVGANVEIASRRIVQIHAQHHERHQECGPYQKCTSAVDSQRALPRDHSEFSESGSHGHHSLLSRLSNRSASLRNASAQPLLKLSS